MSNYSYNRMEFLYDVEQVLRDIEVHLKADLTNMVESPGEAALYEEEYASKFERLKHVSYLVSELASHNDLMRGGIEQR